MAIRKKIHKIDKKEIINAFVEMAKAKNIERDLLQGIIEETLSLIVKKKYGANSDFEIIVNMQKGDIEIYLIKQVVDVVENKETEISLKEANLYSTDKLELGDDFIEEITLDNIADSFGRRLVSYASQAMNFRISELERNNIYNEYLDKVGQLIVGEIFQKRNYMMLVTHNKVEMKLLRADQLPTDNVFYKKNKAIKAIIKEVKISSGGNLPEILLSRNSDDFVKRLFELEVPEVNEGIVQIKAIAREPGERMKVALLSVVDKIDAVGTCVGIKGIRVSSIIRELGNETIDLIQWYENPVKFIEKALSPAKIKEIELFPETKNANVIVSEDQIALAVGKGGLNIRLASRLTGYDLHIIKEESEDIEIQEFESEIGTELLEKLMSNDIQTARDYLNTDIDVLIKKCEMEYETILEIRRVILLEFDEIEDEDYVNKLLEHRGKSVGTNNIDEEDNNENILNETIGNEANNDLESSISSNETVEIFHNENNLKYNSSN